MQSDTNEKDEIASSLQQALRALTSRDFGAAEILFQQTLKRAGDHRSAAQMCLHHLSQMNEQRGNLEEAIRLSLRSLALTRETTGDDSEQVVSSMVRVANLYQTAGRYDEAADLFGRARVISETLVYSKGPEEPQVGASDENNNTPEMSARLRKHFAKKGTGASDQEESQEVAGGAEFDAAAKEGETFNFKENEEQEEGRPRTGALSRAEQKDQPAAGGSGRHSAKNDDDNLKNHKFLSEQPTERSGGFSRDDLAALDQRFRGVAPSEPQAQFREVEPAKRSGGGTGYGGERNQKQSPSRPGNASSDKTKNLRAENEQADFSELIRYFQQLVDSIGVQQMAWSITQYFRNKNNVIAAVIAAVVFIGAVAAWAFSIPVKVQPLEAYLSMPHKFRTTNGDIVIDLPEDGKCNLTMAEATVSSPMSCFVGDWRDALRMAVFSFFAKQIYFDLQEKLLVDDEGTVFYPSNSKVVKLVTQMELIADGATDCFINSKEYPSKVSEVSRDKAPSEFENAFTLHPQLPTMQVQKMPDAPSKAEALLRLQSLYYTLDKGGSWQNEPPLHAGHINCCYFIFPCPDGPIRAFLIQGGDETGAPLIGGHPNNRFFIALEDGKPADFNESYKLSVANLGPRPCMVWIDQSKAPTLLIYLLLHTSALLFFWISMILLVVLAVFRRLSRRTKTILIFAFTVCLAITGVYFL